RHNGLPRPSSRFGATRAFVSLTKGGAMRAAVHCNLSGLGVMFAAALLVLLIPGASGAAPQPPPFNEPIDAQIVSPLNSGQVGVINTAARAPFQRSFPQFVIPINRNVEKSCVAVPFFKRLTIEHVSGSAFFLPANSAIVWFQLETKADGFLTA